MTTDEPIQDSSRERSVARMAAPLVAMGATWAVRKALIKGFEAGTGRPAPVIHSREASVAAKIAWAATLAGVIALVEIVVWKVLDDDAQD